MEKKFKKFAFLLLPFFFLFFYSVSFAQLTDDTPASVTGTQAGGYCPRLSTTFKKGATDRTTNGQVTELQKFLKSNLALSDQQLIVSGVFGNVTNTFVKIFQTANNVPAYGIIGSLTRAKIASVCGIAAADTTNSADQETSLNTQSTQTNSTSVYLGRSCTYQGNNIASGSFINLPRNNSGVSTIGACLQDKISCLNAVMTNVCSQRYAANSVYAWNVSAWNACTNNSQSRFVVCKNVSNGYIATDADCSAQPKPALTQSCTANATSTQPTLTISPTAVTVTTPGQEVRMQIYATNVTRCDSYANGSLTERVGDANAQNIFAPSVGYFPVALLTGQTTKNIEIRCAGTNGTTVSKTLTLTLGSSNSSTNNTTTNNSGTVSVTSGTGGSCVLSNGVTIPDGGTKSLFIFDHGNPANGAMNHDLCIASSASATCTNGNLVGGGSGTTTYFKYDKCWDDQASEDKINYYLTQLYNNILGRAPDTSGFAYWKQQLRSMAVTFEDIKNNFISVKASGTTATSTTATTTADTITPQVIALYSTYLHRTVTATESGVIYWANAIKANTFTFDKLKVQFQITYLYQTILNREPDAGGLSYWVNAVMNNTITLSGVEASLRATLNSSCTNGATNYPTCNNNTTTNNATTSQYLSPVISAYATRLRKTVTASDSGVQYWVTQLDAGFPLPKFYTTLDVTYLYNTILNKEPDAGGLSYWVNAVLSGTITIDGVKNSFTTCKANGSC